MDDLEPPQRSARVRFAMKVAAVEIGCTPMEALQIMNDRAHVEHRTLEEIASGVIEGSVRFDE